VVLKRKKEMGVRKRTRFSHQNSIQNLKHLLLFSWRFLKAIQIINILSKKTLMGT
jgi:hypothetical protein